MEWRAANAAAQDLYGLCFNVDTVVRFDVAVVVQIMHQGYNTPYSVECCPGEVFVLPAGDCVIGWDCTPAPIMWVRG